jgi:hypothetical protein
VEGINMPYRMKKTATATLKQLRADKKALQHNLNQAIALLNLISNTAIRANVDVERLNQENMKLTIALTAVMNKYVQQPIALTTDDLAAISGGSLTVKQNIADRTLDVAFEMCGGDCDNCSHTDSHGSTYIQ